MTKVLLSLGANLGNPMEEFRKVFRRIRRMDPRASMSNLYRTEPIDVLDQPDYFNIAIRFETETSAEDLMTTFLTWEKHSGRLRVPGIIRAPRKLDIDIVLYGETNLMTEHLTVPHPRFRQRRFVLEPAAEIAPDMTDPVTGRTISELLRACADSSRVERFLGESSLV